MSRFNIFVENDANVGAGIDFSDPNSPLARYYLRFGHVAAVAVIVAVFVLLNSVKLWHTDFWGHARFGESLLDLKTFSARDSFTVFADPNAVAVNSAWLSQATMAAVFRFGSWIGSRDALSELASGADAVRFLLAVSVVARFVLLFIAFQRLSRSAVLATLGLVFVVVVGPGNLGVTRPQVFAEVLFAALLVVLSYGVNSWRDIALVAAIMTIWANCHGSYLIGLLLLGATFAGRVGDLAVRQWPEFSDTLTDAQLRRSLWSVFWSVLAIAALNPEGYRIFAATLQMANHPNVRAMDEWQSLFSPIAGGARMTFSACLFLIVGSVALVHGQLPASWWIVLLLFVIPPLFTQRAVVWLITMAPWLAMVPLGQSLTSHRPSWWSSTPSFRKTLVAGGLVAIGLAWSLPVQAMLRQSGGEPAKSLSDGTPWEYALAIDGSAGVSTSPLRRAITEKYPDGKFVGTILASETQGDFFVWRLGGKHPIYTYSHVHLFSPEHWQRFTRIRDTADGWRQLLNDGQVNLVVFEAERKPKICDQLRRDKDWTVIVDEVGNPAKIDPRCRLFVALRNSPLVSPAKAGLQ